MEPTPWLLGRPLPGARLRLLCFPFAGGSAAAFLPWQAPLAPQVELWAVQLPGRASRLAEPPLTSFSALLGELVQLAPRFAEQPFAFFGHSLGALVAFELARTLHARGLDLPRCLIASGASAPSLPASVPPLANAEDSVLIAALRSYGGTPEPVLRDPELLALALPALRADLRLLADHRPAPAPPLPLPITVLGGRGDLHVPLGALGAWTAETERDCEIRLFDGDHFFLQGSERGRVLGVIAQTLERAIRRDAPR